MTESIIDPQGRTIRVETGEDGSFAYTLGGYSLTLRAADRETADEIAREQFANYTP